MDDAPPGDAAMDRIEPATAPADTAAPDKIAMDKAALRRTLRATRRAFLTSLDPRELAELYRGLILRLLPHLEGTTTVCAYVATGGEIDPLEILLHAAGRGIRTALPRIESRDEPMTFRYWTPGEELIPGPLGLTQPTARAEICHPDLILAPLLGFDRTLGRIGQGAGFYDRAFAANPESRRIGLAWSVQEVGLIPTDPWDMPLHGIATEREWIAA
jgi:5-formyltetrahydrofolate cyclo-ligase